MTPEGFIQDLILDWLAAKHILAFRMNTGALKIDKRYVKFGVKGMADILAFPTYKSALLWARCHGIQHPAMDRGQVREGQAVCRTKVLSGSSREPVTITLSLAPSKT